MEIFWCFFFARDFNLNHGKTHNLYWIPHGLVSHLKYIVKYIVNINLFNLLCKNSNCVCPLITMCLVHSCWKYFGIFLYMILVSHHGETHTRQLCWIPHGLVTHFKFSVNYIFNMNMFNLSCKNYNYVCHLIIKFLVHSYWKYFRVFLAHDVNFTS